MLFYYSTGGETQASERLKEILLGLGFTPEMQQLEDCMGDAGRTTAAPTSADRSI